MNETTPACEEVRERLLEPALSPDGQAQLDRHLGACAACREERERVVRTLEAARGASLPIEPHPRTWLKLKEEMDHLKAREEARRRIRQWIIRILAFLAPIAAAWLWWKEKKS